MNTLLRALRIPVGFLIGFGLVWAGIIALDLDEGDRAQATHIEQQRTEHDRVVAKAYRLKERHHCYTGEAPDPEVIPGHSLVLRHGEPTFVTSEVGFRLWESDPDRLLAFCP